VILLRSGLQKSLRRIYSHQPLRRKASRNFPHLPEFYSLTVLIQTESKEIQIKTIT